jgi:NAD(P) transhydrogenase subunit alpha
LLAPHIANADCLITTAAVPGRQAPLLVTREMVEQMPPGSVVVDLAAESGGNVEGSVAGEIVQIGNAQVWGGDNVPASMPGPASRLYAQNVVNLVTLMTRKAEEADGELGTAAVAGAFAPDFEDEIVIGSCVTRDGRIEHKPTREAIEGPDPEPEPEPASAAAPSVEAEGTAVATAFGAPTDEPDVAEPALENPDAEPLTLEDEPLPDLAEPEPDPEPIYDEEADRS